MQVANAGSNYKHIKLVTRLKPSFETSVRLIISLRLYICSNVKEWEYVYVINPEIYFRDVVYS
jgi:hypothetical protein